MTNSQAAEAFSIFAGYDGEGPVAVGSDEMFAGPDSSMVTPAHLARLKELGWRLDEESECFHAFV